MSYAPDVQAMLSPAGGRLELAPSREARKETSKADEVSAGRHTIPREAGMPSNVAALTLSLLINVAQRRCICVMFLDLLQIACIMHADARPVGRHC
jgi:hypothetical protein